MSTEKAPIIVYYNSACPVCDAGIGQQKSRMQGCAVQWQDVHTNTAARGEIPSPLEFVRERLHVIDENGELRVGMEAVLTIWRHSPHEHWKARLLGQPGLRQLTGWAYNIFAAVLYRWNIRKGHW